MIQANPNAPGCEGAQSTPDQTIDQNNILIDKHISLGGYSFPVNTSLEAKVVYAANRLPAYTVGDKELLSFVLPLSFASSEEEGTFFTIDVLYFGLKKGKGVYGVGETQLVTNDIRRGLRTTAQYLNIDLGDIGAVDIADYINVNGPYGARVFKCIISGIAKVYLYSGTAPVIGIGASQVTSTDFIDLTEEPTIPNINNSVIHPLSLTGVDPTFPELKKIAEAVRMRGPFTCSQTQQMVFKTTTTVGTQSNGDIVTRYYRLIKNMTSIGGVGVDELILPSWFMPDGTGEYSNTEAEGIIAELGDIGTADVWTAFNLGNAGEAWDMAEFRFVRATQNGEVRFWAFQGMERYYGGPDMGVEPDIFEAFESDFFLITGQPPAQNEVIFDYDDIDELILRQSEQVIDSVILVRDAIDDTNITFAASENKRQALYKLKSSTKTGSITDYIVTAVPYGNNASIVSLTGIGVDLTDPTNPKIINAQAKKTAAFDIAIDDNGRTIFNNSNTGTFKPSTIAYPNKFEAILKNIGGTDATFVGNAATDWTYIYNNGTPVASISLTYKKAILIQRVEAEKIIRISENISVSQAEMDAKANKRYNVSTAATSVTLIQEYIDADLITTAATDITLTVPLGLVGDFQGFGVGAGKVKPVGAAGVTINVSPLWKKETTGEGAPWGLKQTDVNTYLLYGQLEMI